MSESNTSTSGKAAFNKKAEQPDPNEVTENEITADEVIHRFEAIRRFVVTCSECQSEMSADWHFCTDCGSRLATECPSCNQPLPPYGARFCPHCGLLIPRIEGKRD